MKYSVAGKTVFVTGAARGIGAATARVLAARGARVALAGLEPELLASVCAELGDAHIWIECDVTRQDQLDAAVKRTAAELGGIDIVVANAGISCNGTVAVTPIDVLIRVIDVNLSGVIRTVSATLPYVTERRGHILLISSAASFVAAPGISAYAAAKAGVEHFGHALRLEVGHKGVTVGSAHPAWIDTDLVRDAQKDLQSFNDMVKTMPGPLGVVTPAAECARVLVDGIEQRSRKIYIPRVIGVISAMRALLNSRLGEAAVAKRARESVPKLEGEVAAMGRYFGTTSVGKGVESSRPSSDVQ
jgi:NAD(P)-dependent dehydrogenase (short-subunit alcohol dehydrogenase family)